MRTPRTLYTPLVDSRSAQPLARTRVTRCLIGEPGMTYKYLGLRMFSHPWRGASATVPLRALRKLSRKLARRAERLGADPSRCAYNIVLLNRMAPEDASSKQESAFGMGAVAVSWHADSSLQDFSSISVYVAEHDAQGDNWDEAACAAGPSAAGGPHPWHVALRVVRDVEGPTMRTKLLERTGPAKQDDATTPAVRVPMHDGDAYHMLGAFNHHHQHAVIQGRGAVRYSSTHRVALEDGHSYSSIRRRCLAALSQSNPVETAQDTARKAGAAAENAEGGGCSALGLDATAPAAWQEEQLCLNEVEVRGSSSAELRPYVKSAALFCNAGIVPHVAVRMAPAMACAGCRARGGFDVVGCEDAKAREALAAAGSSNARSSPFSADAWQCPCW